MGGIFGGGQAAPQFAQGAMPTRPDYISALSDPNTGQLKAGYQVTGAPGTALDMSAANAIQKQALAAPGQSEWGNLMRTQAGTQQAAARSNLEQQNASDLAQAKSSLAQQKGLSSGASERLAMNNQRNQASGMQNLGAQGQNQLLNIGTQEEQNRQQNLQQSVNNSQNAATYNAGLKQFDVGNAMNSLQGQNAANLAAYGDQMQKYAAAGQANSISNSRGKK